MNMKHRQSAICRVSVFVLTVMLLVAAPIAVSAREAADVDENAAGYGTGYQQMTTVYVGELEETHVCRAQYSAAASEYWDRFGSDYFYQQMNSQEKAFYNGLYRAAMNLLEGTQDAEASVVGGEIYTHLPYVTSDSLGRQQAQVVASIFQLSNPQFYFISDVMLWGYDSKGIQFTLGIYEDFADGIARSRYTSQFKNRVDTLLTQVNAQSDPVSRERKAHDLILEKAVYSYGKYHQSSAGVFLEGKAVCAGYSEAFALLCNGAGIETISVTSENHEWNKVRLYGRWYGVDCTWDDTGAGNYEYFNVTDAYLEGVDTDHKLENIWNGYQVPACVNSTLIRNGSYIYQGIDYSDVFDEYYYVDRYPDLKAAYGSDWKAALEHFVLYGMSEGRQAHEDFDVYAYRAQYKDLREVYGNDLASYYRHYISYGKRENRRATGSHVITSGVTYYRGTDYSDVYDYNYYVANNPDVARAYPGDDILTLGHFVNYGMAEGRRAKESFDVYAYRAQHPDLRRVFGMDLKGYYRHYINYGRAERRAAVGSHALVSAVTVCRGVDYSAVYDYNYYIANNPDVNRAFPGNEEAVLAHFVDYGMKEGRRGNAAFDVNSYRMRYMDLRIAYGQNTAAYYLHFMNYGRSEGRIATGTVARMDGVTVYNGVDYAAVYDYDYYINAYGDIRSLYGNDDLAVLEHFVKYGMSEGRQGSSHFNACIYRGRYADLNAVFGDNCRAYYLHYMEYGIEEGRKAE